MDALDRHRILTEVGNLIRRHGGYFEDELHMDIEDFVRMIEDPEFAKLFQKEHKT